VGRLSALYELVTATLETILSARSNAYAAATTLSHLI